VKRVINEDLQVMPGAESEPLPRKSSKGQPTLAVAEGALRPEDVVAAIQELEQAMRQAAEALEFERAALLRDELKALRKTYELK
jgi:excinuclease UvrABC helicase subunit UvrB